jgi:hypothetical protein
LIDLSERMGRLRTAAHLRPMTNLRLTLHPHGRGAIPGALNAKVTEATDGTCLMRFTAIDSEVRAFIAAVPELRTREAD